MEIIDNYFRVLRMFLPKDQRDDIIRELSEEIGAQVADQQAELGRPLNRDEQATVVGQYGHPLLIAARYRPQRYLVGPVVFPLLAVAQSTARPGCTRTWHRADRVAGEWRFDDRTGRTAREADRDHVEDHWLDNAACRRS